MTFNNHEDFPVQNIKGIGEKRATALGKLGITSAMDLVTHYPRGYIDFNDTKPICDIIAEEAVAVKAVVTRKLSPYIGRISIYKAIVNDGTGDMLVTFFNSDYSFRSLILDKEYYFYGKAAGDFLRKEMTSPIFVDAAKGETVLPRYHLTQGISNNMMSGYVKSALSQLKFQEELPEYLMEKYRLMDFSKALHDIHFPENMRQYEAARYRLSFGELFALQLGLKSIKQRKKKQSGAKMEDISIDEFYSSLPFTLTGAQLNAIKECCCDMTGDAPMNRLLQGDVGSGKTAVAAALCYFAAQNGFQSTLMAPTEILAKQHYDTLCGFLSPLGIKVALLIGSQTAAQKKQIRQMLASGEADVAVGTQTLIQKSTGFNNLGLVITDEQHRFGVEQRAELTAKGINPHTLVMSATPIPRTLGMIIYGDLDISILDEMPKGRIPIKTYAVDTSFRQRLYKFILKHIESGYQAYIVCPLIDEGISEKAAATQYIESLQSTCLKDVGIGLLHGKMKQSEKDAVMLDFKLNNIKVLVSTTVIEVGVDVPNAVVMLIENAEQFGLSQLHQLRGRVGRGNVQSYCVLITDNTNDYTKQRMDIMAKTSDGFEIANRDLQLRGPGDFFGSRQHGLPALKIADIAADTKLIKLTEQAVNEVLAKDADLVLPCHSGIKAMVERMFSKAVGS